MSDIVERLAAEFAPEHDRQIVLSTTVDADLLRDAVTAIRERDAEIERLMDGMEWAWAIIANGQYWDATDTVRHPEWEQAKFKWRDEHWHPALDRNKEARREQ